MANQVYEVHSDISPEEVTIIAAAVYREWLAFALGGFSIGGKTLKHPSGRYAAAISWRQTGTASVALIADEDAAPEALWIEEGRSGADMKAAMLAGGKIGKDGYRYRTIPIRKDGTIPKTAQAANIVRGKSGGERLGSRIAKIWAKPRPAVNASHYAVMSNRPGAAAWQIPDMPAYAPAKILSDLLRQQLAKAAA